MWVGFGLGWEGGGVRLGLEQVPPRLGKVAANHLGPVRQRQRPCGPLPPHTHPITATTTVSRAA